MAIPRSTPSWAIDRGILDVRGIEFSELQLHPIKTTKLNFKERTGINSVSRQKPSGERQITISGLMAYTALWALIIGLCRQAVKLKQGIHTITEARLSDTLMLIITGLLFVAIGLPITLVVGRKRQVVPISLGCFFVGFFAIPFLIAVLVTLDRFGGIKLDL